jgi:beta-lactam-binding protein with PASTA domain
MRRMSAVHIPLFLAALAVAVTEAGPTASAVSAMPNNNIVRAGGSATVPDVRELRPAGAATLVRDAGLVPRFTGAVAATNSYVASQSPRAGQAVQQGSTVTMSLRNGPVP